jgi:hypothetical protein
LGPILCLLEFAVGLKPDASRNELVWEAHSARPVGCERYRFNGHVVSLKAEPVEGDAGRLNVSVESDGSFTLTIERTGQRKTYAVASGRRQFVFPAD